MDTLGTDEKVKKIKGKKARSKKKVEETSTLDCEQPKKKTKEEEEERRK